MDPAPLAHGAPPTRARRRGRYRYAPDADLPLRSVLPGALVAVLSWGLASLAFSFFLGVFPVHGVAYGSLGTAISLLLYLAELHYYRTGYTS